MEQARIAIMLPKYSRYGGVEQFGYRIASALAERGHHVDFICARQEIEAAPGVNVLPLGRPRGPKHIKMLRFAGKAGEMIDIGEYHCTIGLGKTLYQNILRVGGAPLKEFWRYSERAFPDGPIRWFKMLRRHLNRSNRLTRVIENRQYNSGCKIVAVSHFVRNLIVKTYPHLKAEDISVIYNQPDFNRFYPPSPKERESARQALKIAPGVMAVGLATSNYELKGTGPLIKTLANLPENFELFVAGGRNHLRYDWMASRLGLKKRVHFLGKVDDMPQFYHAMDIFTLPTFYDACSNAVLEALATGLPVTSSASNGSSFFLPRENIILNPNNTAEQAEVLLRLAEQAAQNKASGARPSFHWPEGIDSGMDGFVKVVEDFLARREELLRGGPQAAPDGADGWNEPGGNPEN